ncbi:MAG: hypothetical protein L3K26_05825 [Candidatus Hydrogenedentes bacterium]|nr:hypothetical protein [Candidatus Hydrogenedentota bacterium]
MPYDVESTMCHKHSPDVARAIKSVNLMCFLLDDVTYNELYRDDFRVAIPKILAQAEKLGKNKHSSLNRGAYDDDFPIKDLLVGAFTDIRDNIAANPPVTLGNLFYLDPTTKEDYILSRLDTLYSKSYQYGSNDCELDHLCCPFRYFQQNPADRDDGTNLRDFLGAWGDKKMIQLYIERKKDYPSAKIDQIRNARTNGILHDRSAKFSLDPKSTVKPSFVTNPFANGLICDGGVCATGAPSDWCNDASGSCSAASSP